MSFETDQEELKTLSVQNSRNGPSWPTLTCRRTRSAPRISWPIFEAELFLVVDLAGQDQSGASASAVEDAEEPEFCERAERDDTGVSLRAALVCGIAGD